LAKKIEVGNILGKPTPTVPPAYRSTYSNLLRRAVTNGKIDATDARQLRVVVDALKIDQGTVQRHLDILGRIQDKGGAAAVASTGLDQLESIVKAIPDGATPEQAETAMGAAVDTVAKHASSLEKPSSPRASNNSQPAADVRTQAMTIPVRRGF
jgi:hypothetical protein